MSRMLIGSLAAGLTMFVLGFIFFGSPLYPVLSGDVGMDGQPEVVQLISGFVQLSVAAYCLAMLLSLVSAGQRMQVTIWAAITAVVFTYLGDPIWEGADWRLSIYSAIAGFIMLWAAGYVLTRWFAPASVMAPAE